MNTKKRCPLCNHVLPTHTDGYEKCPNLGLTEDDAEWQYCHCRGGGCECCLGSARLDGIGTRNLNCGVNKVN